MTPAGKVPEYRGWEGLAFVDFGLLLAAIGVPLDRLFLKDLKILAILVERIE